MNRAERRRRESLNSSSATARKVERTLAEGLEHHGARRFAEARRSYKKVLRQDARNARALFLMGTLALQEKDYPTAESLIKKAIAEDPKDPSFHNNLGVILRESGHLEEALDCYRQAIELRPEYAEAHCNLGIALRELGQLEDAILALEHTIELDPSFGGAYSNLGNAYNAVGRTGEAMPVFDKALGLNPHDLSAHFNRAIANQDRGYLDAAQDGFRDVLRLQPQHGEAWRLLSGLKRFASADDNDIEEMPRLLRDATLKKPDEMHVQFGLGKALVDIGEFDDAFRQIAAANAAYRNSYEYDIEKDAEYFESIQDVFSEEFLSDREGWGSASDRPIFIVGMMRSGTSLVEQILASHPSVTGCGELTELDRLTRNDEARPGGLDYPQSMRSLDRTLSKSLAEEYLRRVQVYAPGAERTTDKMPGNFLHIGLIRVLLPNATIIHCARDPVDTCLSCFRNYFAGFHSFAYDLEDLGTYYCLYQKLMDHWRSVASINLHEICYEDLVANPEDEIRRLLHACGLSWNDQCLNFHQTTRPVRTASAAQVRRPMYSSSVEAWRKFESHLGPLLRALS